MKKTSTSTDSKPTLDQALANIPVKFRSRIIKEYKKLKERYSKALYDAEFDVSGLSAGRFVETVLRCLQHELTGTFIPFGKHIPNLPAECRTLMGLPKTAGNESLRIIIPRALVFLYTIRGKRGIGHVGGDVEADAIDARTIVRVCDWIVCELIRIYHKLSLEEAQAIVDVLSTRTLPDIWEIGGKKRVLRTDLSTKGKTLLLAYADIHTGVLVEDLYSWVDYSNLGMFKVRVLKPLHDKRLIEYDRESGVVFISPLGIQEVENKILRQPTDWA
jgi:hypothetical protein